MTHLQPDAVISVVDDDSTARALRAGALGAGLRAVVFADIEQFASSPEARQAGFLVVDRLRLLAWQELPNSGIDEAFGRLHRQRIRMPVVVTAAECSHRAVVEAMRAGAFSVVAKPCDEDELALVSAEALAHDQVQRKRWAELDRLERRFSSLTAGEFQVLEWIVDGLSNQDIASKLALSVRAVEARRARLMKKTRADSLAELIRITLTVQGDGRWLSYDARPDLSQPAVPAKRRGRWERMAK